MSGEGLFFKHARHDWTRERIERMPAQDIKQLRANAERLGESELAALCGELLKTLSRLKGATHSVASRGAKPRRLIARVKAFEARGVWLEEAHTSWGGVRKADGAVVMALWADAVELAEGACRYLLWAPNVDGSRPWSETPAGQERLRHCKLALEGGGAEGMLVYGEHLDGEAAEHNARTIYGVDPERVVRFQVEKRGDAYWAVWGAKGAPRPL